MYLAYNYIYRLKTHVIKYSSTMETYKCMINVSDSEDSIHEAFGMCFEPFLTVARSLDFIVEL